MAGAGLRAIFMSVVCAVSAHAADDLPRVQPGEKTVYMVLMANTDMVHVSEMSSMAECREAIRFVEQAECLEAVKPPSGGLPVEIRGLVPPPGAVQDSR
ncbi:MAG: hypothetical protein WD407_08400 [Rhodospirillales bacterium]